MPHRPGPGDTNSTPGPQEQAGAPKSDGRTTTYEYDGMRRVVRMEYPHGWVEEYEYDAIGQLLNVTDSDPSGKDMKQQKHVYQYDDCGKLIENGDHIQLYYRGLPGHRRLSHQPLASPVASLARASGPGVE